ncbi:MAG: hypothetical protein L3J71_03380 [Victivallaceae bacterium]|nr:hypothetical protein [Victivallaceae bacterium]
MSEDAKKDDVKEVAATTETVDAKSETKPETKPAETDTAKPDTDAKQPEAPEKKKNMILRTLLLAILVIAAAFAIKHHMLTNDFNEALDLKEAGKIDVAIVKFESLAENAYGNIKKQASQELLKCYIESGDQKKAVERLEKMAKDPSVSKTELAQCYIVLGDAPSNNAAQTKEYYKKAMDIAPEILTPIQRKVVDPSYVLPKPPPPTPEELAEAKKMEAEMLAEEAKIKAAKPATDALKAIPGTK